MNRGFYFVLAICTIIILERKNITKETFFNFESISENDDTLRWNQGKLCWKDFNGIAPKDTVYGAVSFVAISLKYTDSANFYLPKICSFFLKSKSWVSDQELKYGDSSGLVHEQGHFDLEEFYARKLRMLLNMNGWHKIPQEEFAVEINVKINAYYAKITKEAVTNQLRYDIETNHSLNEEAQIKWNQNISDSLTKYKNY